MEHHRSEPVDASFPAPSGSPPGPLLRGYSVPSCRVRALASLGSGERCRRPGRPGGLGAGDGEERWPRSPTWRAQRAEGHGKTMAALLGTWSEPGCARDEVSSSRGHCGESTCSVIGSFPCRIGRSKEGISANLLLWAKPLIQVQLGSYGRGRSFS